MNISMCLIFRNLKLSKCTFNLAKVLLLQNKGKRKERSRHEDQFLTLVWLIKLGKQLIQISACQVRAPEILLTGELYIQRVMHTGDGSETQKDKTKNL